MVTSGTTDVSPQQMSLAQHSISAGRPITYFDPTTGKPAGVTEAGGTFYSVGANQDLLFRSQAEAQAYAARQGQVGTVVGQSYAVSPTGAVTPVSSEQYWEAKTAKEQAAQAAFGGVRTETMLAPKGAVLDVQKAVSSGAVPGYVLESPKGKEYFLTEQAANIRALQLAPKPGEPGYHGTVERPLGLYQPQELVAPQPRPSTPTLPSEFGYIPIDVNYLIGTPEAKTLTQQYREAMPRFQVQTGRVIETYAYSPGIELKDMFGGKTEVKPGMRYMRDIFGLTSETPMITGAPKVTEEQAAAIKFSEQIGLIGASTGAGGVLTTTAGLRGATLIQPGDFAAIARSLKMVSPKVKAGFGEFISSEEAAVTFGRERPTPKPRSASTTAEVYSQIRAAASKQILEPPRTISRVEPSKPVQEYTLVMPEKLESILEPSHVQVPYYSSKGTMAGSIDVSVARMRSVYASKPSPAKSIEEQRAILTEYFGELKTPSKVIQIQEPMVAQIPVQKSIAVSEAIPISKEIAVPVSISKALTIQKQIALTEQISKSMAITVPIEIGITKQMAIPISQQIADTSITAKYFGVNPADVNLFGYTDMTITPTGILQPPQYPRIPTPYSPYSTPPSTPPYVPPYTPPYVPPSVPPEIPPYTPPSTPPYTPPDIPPGIPKIKIPWDERKKRKAKGKRKEAYTLGYRATPLIEPLAGIEDLFKSPKYKRTNKSKKVRR